jgi:hypothetical protein
VTGGTRTAGHTGPRLGGNLAEAHLSYTDAASQIELLSALLVASAQAIEKVLHRHVERQRKLIQRTSRYAISGPFVFLQLLKRNPDRVGKRGLALPAAAGATEKQRGDQWR